MSFRNPKNVSKIDYVPFELQTPINQAVANNATQNKTGYRFYVDNSNEVNPFDWYNAYIEIKFKINDVANGAATGNVASAFVNSSYMMIKKLDCEVNGETVMNNPYANHAVNVRNLDEFSSSYHKVASTSQFYLDDPPFTAALDDNSGFTKRKELIEAGADIDTIIHLNRYSFFSAFENNICPPTQVTINITLEEDDNFCWRTGNNRTRYIVTKMKLWVPKMYFNADGESIYIQSYLNPHKWSYLKERIVISPPSQAISGTFRITSSIKKPRHCFVWALNTNKLNDREQNPFLFNTYAITANNRNVTSCQLEVGNGYYVPTISMKPFNEEVITYNRLLEYNRWINDKLRWLRSNFGRTRP